MIIAPSILNADFGNLQREITMLNDSQADWIHVDVMDGVFVPNLSYGFPIMKTLKEYAKKPLDVHLMIVNPEQYVERFVQAGASGVTVQYEACTHLHRVIEQIKNAGAKASVAINPHTVPTLLEEVIEMLDMVLVMSVNPGFGGQKFIENSLNKISQTKEIIQKKKSNALIEVDGGIGLHNASKLKEAGADVLVVGSSVFTASNPMEEIAALKAV